MTPLQVQQLYAAASDSQKLQNAIEKWSMQNNPADLMTSVDCQTLLELLNPLNEELQKLECRASWATLNKFWAAMQNNSLSYRQATGLIDELDGRIRDELAHVTAFTLSTAEANLVTPSLPLISQEFETNYPSATYDVGECAKCLAFGRGTAAVFHAMRVMERGVAAVARCLDIPDAGKPAQKTWGSVMERVRVRMEELWPAQADRETGDGATFENIYALLEAVRNPWRNATMHPAKQYDLQQANRIVNAMGAFMDELAKRCNEEGLPKVDTTGVVAG